MSETSRRDANLVREMAYAAAKFVATDDRYWAAQMDYLERELSGDGAPGELSAEQTLDIIREWESSASKAATVAFRDFGNGHSSDFEVRMPGDVLAWLLRMLRAKIENAAGYPQPPSIPTEKDTR